MTRLGYVTSYCSCFALKLLFVVCALKWQGYYGNVFPLRNTIFLIILYLIMINILRIMFFWYYRKEAVLIIKSEKHMNWYYDTSNNKKQDKTNIKNWIYFNYSSWICNEEIKVTMWVRFMRSWFKTYLGHQEL